jgi:hypothetical protein
MKNWISALGLVACIYAQTPATFGPSAEIKIPAGTLGGTVLIPLDHAPFAKDSFGLELSSQTLTIVLLTPDGKRVTEQNASELGFYWHSNDVQVPIGATDSQRLVTIGFEKPGVAGTYSLELSRQSVKSPVGAKVHFSDFKLAMTANIRQFPNIKIVGPFSMQPGSGPLEVVLDQEEEGAIFDFISSDPSAKLALTLPGGRIIDESVGDKGPDVGWKSAASPDEVDRPTAWFNIGGFLLPSAGRHNVVMFQKAAAGTYQIRSLNKPTQITAEFIPLGRMLKDDKPPALPPGEVMLQATALPNSCKLGQPVNARFQILGEPLTDLKFEVRMEYRQIVSTNPLKYSEPVVERVAAEFV